MPHRHLDFTQLNARYRRLSFRSKLKLSTTKAEGDTILAGLLWMTSLPPKVQWRHFPQCRLRALAGRPIFAQSYHGSTSKLSRSSHNPTRDLTDGSFQRRRFYSLKSWIFRRFLLFTKKFPRFWASPLPRLFYNSKFPASNKVYQAHFKSSQVISK